MSPDLQNKLYAKYPFIFKEKDLPHTKSCMAFGLGIGDGWYEIMDALCATVNCLYSTSAFIDDEGAKKFSIPLQSLEFPPNKPRIATIGELNKPIVRVEPPQVVFVQVKEKFGSLRIYYRLEFDKIVEDLWAFRQYPSLETVMHDYSSVVDGSIRFAEVLSLRTCELTGTPGSMHVSKNGWFKVLCAERAAELGFSKYSEPEDLP